MSNVNRFAAVPKRTVVFGTCLTASDLGISGSKPFEKEVLVIDLIGALGEIRTPDPQIRSLVLYPAELRARI